MKTFILACLFLVALIGCENKQDLASPPPQPATAPAVNNNPPEEAVKTSFRNLINNESPWRPSDAKFFYNKINMEINGNKFLGITLKNLDINKYGIYNDRERYWPVHIHFSGDIKTGMGIAYDTKLMTCSFDGYADILMTKDDYGQWVARYSPGSSVPKLVCRE